MKPSDHTALFPMSKAIAELHSARARFQLKVTLLDLRPAIGRRLLAPALLKLSTLHAMLQIGFGWTKSHLHAFHAGVDSYEAYYPESWEEPWGDGALRDESRFRLCDLLHGKGDRLLYEYDFGDSWRHEIRVEKIEPVELAAPVACVAGARAALPEDCGRFRVIGNLSKRWPIRGTRNGTVCWHDSAVATIRKPSTSMPSTCNSSAANCSESGLCHGTAVTHFYPAIP